jgi:hypothetical protein
VRGSLHHIFYVGMKDGFQLCHCLRIAEDDPAQGSSVYHVVDPEDGPAEKPEHLIMFFFQCLVTQGVHIDFRVTVW